MAISAIAVVAMVSDQLVEPSLTTLHSGASAAHAVTLQAITATANICAHLFMFDPCRFFKSGTPHVSARRMVF
jgi:hypothetical protein